jgi:hypothetical protein
MSDDVVFLGAATEIADPVAEQLEDQAGYLRELLELGYRPSDWGGVEPIR